MKRRFSAAAAIGALALLHLIGFVAPSAADGYEHHHRYRHRVQVTYVAYPAYYTVCRIGWWQTVRYGHVRPRWAEYCR